MAARFCQECGAELPPPGRSAESGDRAAARRCRKCGAVASQRPSVGCAGIVVREKPRGPRGPGGAEPPTAEVLLVRRGPMARHGAGRWCIPCGYVEWSEDVRDAARRELAEEAGVDVEITDVYEVLSNFHDPDRLTVGTWFRAKLRDKDAEPRPGDDADRAEFFPLDALPTDLAFENDRRVLERLGREYKGGKLQDAARRLSEVEALYADSDARLERRRQRYRDLLELYTSELMRGAWLNDLLLRLSKLEGTTAISQEASTHLGTQRDVQSVKIYLPGPPDLCDRCPWRERCSRDRCLHLVAGHGHSTPETRSNKPSGEGAIQDDVRIPLLRDVPAAEVSTKGTPVRAELDAQGPLPLRFEGFPLDVGLPVHGVVGVVTRAPLDVNTRRLCEIVGRHMSALVRNARLVADLRAASKAKSAFIARMSHEFKTPLTAILGYAELLREERTAAGDEMGADGLGTIEASGRKLLGLVESILEIAKLESGSIALSPARIDVAAIVRSMCDRYAQQAKDKGIILELAPLPSKDETIVWADPQKIGRVVEELVSNAIKFTAEGRVDVLVKAGPEQVQVEVQDTGIGVSSMQVDRLFEPFGQADESVHIEYGGLGIGLAVAKTLIDMHGGRIGVESSPGMGSRFYFFLPRRARTQG